MVVRKEGPESKKECVRVAVLRMLLVLMHVYVKSILLGWLNFQVYEATAYACLIYTLGTFLSVFAAAYAILSVFHSVDSSILNGLLAMFSYACATFIYNAVVSCICRMLWPHNRYVEYLMIFSSSMTYLPLVLLLSELECVRDDFLVVGLATASTLYVYRNTVERGETKNTVLLLVGSILLVLMLYIPIHIYKNTLLSQFHTFCGIGWVRDCLAGSEQAR